MYYLIRSTVLCIPLYITTMNVTIPYYDYTDAQCTSCDLKSFCSVARPWLGPFQCQALQALRCWWCHKWPCVRSSPAMAAWLDRLDQRPPVESSLFTVEH